MKTWTSRKPSRRTRASDRKDGRITGEKVEEETEDDDVFFGDDEEEVIAAEAR